MDTRIPLPLTLLGALVAAGLLFAACGSDSAGSESADPPADVEAAEQLIPDVDPETGEPFPIDPEEGGPALDDELPAGLPEGPLGGGSLPIGTIEFVISHPDEADVAYTVSCLGDVANISGEVDLVDFKVCEALNDPNVRARLIDGPPGDEACTQEFGSAHIAVITGELDGNAIDTKVDRTDGCGISDWDAVLAGVLIGVA